MNFISIAEEDQVRRVVPSTQSDLDNRLPGSLTIDIMDTPRAIYRNLAERSGLNVLFDQGFEDGPASCFHVDNVRVVDALDLLALQSATLWQPLNESTLLVEPDSQQARRDRIRTLLEVIFLPRTVSLSNLMETLNLLRTALALRSIYLSPEQKAILVKGTPQEIFLAEKVVADLARNEPRPASVQLTPATSSFLVATGWVLGNAEKARPLLDVKLRSRTTINLNETSQPRQRSGSTAAFAAGRAGHLPSGFDRRQRQGDAKRRADGPRLAGHTHR